MQGFIKVTDYQAKLLKLKSFDVVLPRIKSKSSGRNKIKTVMKIDKNDSVVTKSSDSLHECEKCDYTHLGK